MSKHTPASAAHTPEPWSDYGPESSTPKTLSAADYERARACVNACTGIPTEALKQGSMKKLLEVLEESEEYFDQRADAEYFTDSPAPHPNEEMRLLCMINEALASFKEEG